MLFSACCLVRIVPVICDGYHHPDSEALSQIAASWTQEDKQMLANFGITMDIVREAYEYLTRLPAVELPRFANVERQETSILEILNRCNMQKRMKMTTMTITK